MASVFNSMLNIFLPRKQKQDTCSGGGGLIWAWRPAAQSCRGSSGSGRGGGERRPKWKGARGGQLGLGGCSRLWSGSSGEEEPVQVTGHCRDTRVGPCPAGNAPGLRRGRGGLPGFPFSLCCLLVFLGKMLILIRTSFPRNKMGVTDPLHGIFVRIKHDYVPDT